MVTHNTELSNNPKETVKIAADSYCQFSISLYIVYTVYIPSQPPHTHPNTHTPFAQTELVWTLRFPSQPSIFSCRSFSLSLEAFLIVRFKGLQSLQQWRRWRGQEAARREKEAKPASCRELSPCLSVQTDWPTGTSSALLHRGMMAAGYFKVEVSKRPPTGKRTDRPAAV